MFWRREEAQAVVRPYSPAPTVALSATDAPHPIRLTTDTIERVRDLAPGWDKYMLERMYIDWAASKDAARNEDARFLGWVKSFTKGKPSP